MAEQAATEQATADYWYLRIGAGLGIVGSLASMVGNLLHPATPKPSLDPEGVARVIAESDIWIPVHLTIVLGLVLMLPGLVALADTITGGLAGGLARLGRVTAIAGVTVGAIDVMVDGGAAKYLADAWAVAPPEEQAAALRVTLAGVSIDFAMAGLFNILFAGVTFIFLGLAVAFGDVYPRGTGWVAAVAGVGSIVIGTVQMSVGETTTFTRTLTYISPTIITVWTAALLVLLSTRLAAQRRAAAPERAS
jgi:hypothetical protein